MAIDKDVLDQLLAGRDPVELFAEDGLLDELRKALSERMLAAELDDHLEAGSAEGAINKPTQRLIAQDDDDGYVEGDAGCTARSGRNVQPEADRKIPAPVR